MKNDVNKVMKWRIQVGQTMLEKSEHCGSTEVLVREKQMTLRELENTSMVHLEKFKKFGG